MTKTDSQFYEGAKPWSPSGVKEVVTDVASFGVLRLLRRSEMLHTYTNWDGYRKDWTSRSPVEAPELLQRVVPGAEKLAKLGLSVVTAAQAVHIETYQGYSAVAAHQEDGTWVAGANYAGANFHRPTLYRVQEETGKNYMRDLREAGILAVLVAPSEHEGRVDVEGVGAIANEFANPYHKTGRVSDATFLVRGLPTNAATEFVGALRKWPAGMLDAVAYTAFAGIDPPGTSLLQTPQGHEPNSLFVPGVCTGVMAAS